MDSYTAAVTRLRTDLNAGSFAREAYLAMQALRRSDHVTLADDLEWLTPVVMRFKDDTPGFRRFLLELLEARGERRTKIDGEGDHKILRDLYRLLYQTTLMSERRARINKAIEIYRRQGYELTNAKRALLSAEQLKAWAAQRATYFEQVKAAAGGTFTWFDRCAAAEKFWTAIDAALDAKLKE